MESEVKKDVLIAEKTVIKLGNTEYEVYAHFSDKNTLREKLLRLMIKDLDNEE